MVMRLAQWELSCAPVGVAEIWLDNDSDMLLITRIPGSKGRRLVPCSQLGAFGSDVPTEAKRQLMRDVDRLMEHDLACSAITEQFDAWYILEDEPRIIIANWQLAHLPQAAKSAYRSRVVKLLGIDE